MNRRSRTEGAGLVFSNGADQVRIFLLGSDGNPLTDNPRDHLFRFPSPELECAGSSSSAIFDFITPFTEGAASAEDAIDRFTTDGTPQWDLREDWHDLDLATIQGNVDQARAIYVDDQDKTYLVLSARSIDGLWKVDGYQSCSDVSTAKFFDSLQRGRWKLSEASEKFPDRDVPEQGIFFWSQVEPGDRVGFYGLGCFASDAFLRWNEPGVASVVPDETGVVIARPDDFCEPSPGIVNHPPAIGSSLHVDLDGDFVAVKLYDPAGIEQWNARFEFHKYHILEDQ